MARNPAICHPFPFPPRVPWGNKMALTMTHFMIASVRDPSPLGCPLRWFKTHGSFPERRGTVLEQGETRRNERLERGRLTWRKKVSFSSQSRSLMTAEESKQGRRATGEKFPWFLTAEEGENGLPRRIISPEESLGLDISGLT